MNNTQNHKVDVLALNKRKNAERFGPRVLVMADGTVKVGK